MRRGFFSREAICLEHSSRATVPATMSEDAVMVEGSATSADEGSADVVRIYEIGYTIIPTVKEEELEKVKEEFAELLSYSRE